MGGMNRPASPAYGKSKCLHEDEAPSRLCSPCPLIRLELILCDCLLASLFKDLDLPRLLLVIPPLFLLVKPPDVSSPVTTI